MLISEDLAMVKVMFANEIRVSSMELLTNVSSDRKDQCAHIADLAKEQVWRSIET